MMRKCLDKILVALLSVAMLVSCLSFVLVGGFGADNTAYAVTSEAVAAETYGSKTTESIWYYGAGYLNLAALKSTVASWGIDSNLALKSYLAANPIVIACIDTGINATHEIFDNVLLENSTGEIMGYNAYAASQKNETEVNNISDNVSTYHGTAVASVMAMLIKELGVQDYVKIYPIKASYTVATGSNAGKDAFPLVATTAALARAKEMGADVINMSFGSYSSVIDEANKAAQANNTTNADDYKNDDALLTALADFNESAVMVAAAGNIATVSGKIRGGNSAIDAFYPAANENVIGVAGYNTQKKKYEDSNFGDAYTLYAPGEDIYVAQGGINDYIVKDGTSFAAPFVSSAAALLELKYAVENFADGTSEIPAANVISRIVRRHNNSSVVKVTSTLDGESVTYETPMLELNNLLTSDFSALETTYIEATGILATDNTGLFASRAFNYSVTDKTELSFAATLLPAGEVDPEFARNIAWTLKDEEGNEKVLGYGATLQWTPSAADILSKADAVNLTLAAEYGNFKSTFAITFAFQPYNSGAVRVERVSGVYDGVIYTGEKAVFKLSNVENFNMNCGVTWYVNGEEYFSGGSTFEFVAPGDGVYTIDAKYNNWTSKVLYGVSVKATFNPWLLATLVVVGAVSASSLGVVIAALAKRKKVTQTFFKP